jgi:uncharacterized protein YvpB
MNGPVTFTQLRWVLLILLLAFLAGLITLLFWDRREPKSVEIIESPLATAPSLGAIEQTPLPIVSPKPLPSKVTLDVPFIVQAPFAVWDELHEEACEEASLIMLHYFREGKTTFSREETEKDITDLVKFETDHGYQVDVTTKELSIIARDYYSMTTGRVEENITIDDIKQELAAGRPVIIPAAGKILPNPYFTAGGPDYHMLVITGYDAEGFITNDPGTRRGQNFRYKFDELFNAIHDWNNGQSMLDGPKRYLVFD